MSTATSTSTAVGVNIGVSSIQATKGGGIVISGTGGTGTPNYGVNINGNLLANSGTINITGVAGNTSNDIQILVSTGLKFIGALSTSFVSVICWYNRAVPCFLRMVNLFP